MNYRVLIAAALIATLAQAREVDTELPKPWFKNGQAPAVDECLAGVDSAIEAAGTSNLTLKCEAQVGGFVGVMQNFSASDYIGQRIRFSALVKAQGVETWGGLWMRVDNIERRTTAFDNMQRRPIKGTNDWAPYSVVLDVSRDAEGIFFGTILTGKGQLWISDLRFEVVGPDVPTTGVEQSSQPGNLQLAR
jgi:hypothetical protein